MLTLLPTLWWYRSTGVGRNLTRQLDATDTARRIDGASADLLTLQAAMSRLIASDWKSVQSTVPPSRRLSTTQQLGVASALLSSMSDRLLATSWTDGRVLPQVVFAGCPVAPDDWVALVESLGGEALFLVNEDLDEFSTPEHSLSSGDRQSRSDSSHRALELCRQHHPSVADRMLPSGEYVSTLLTGTPPLPVTLVVLPSASQSSLSSDVTSLVRLLLLGDTPAPSGQQPRAPQQRQVFVPVGWRLDLPQLLERAVSFARAEQQHEPQEQSTPRTSAGHPVKLLRTGLLAHPLSSASDLVHYLLTPADSSHTPSAAMSQPQPQPQRTALPSANALRSLARHRSDTTELHAALPNPPQQTQRLIVITPTYDRAVQRACLIRLAAQLSGVPDLLWVVVEDAQRPLQSTRLFLEGTGVAYVYLHQPSDTSRHRGVLQRNRALEEIDALGVRGVVLLIDDDNTVDSRYFVGARTTEQIRLCSVGLVAQDSRRHERIPCADVVHPDAEGRLTAFWSSFDMTRPFPVDMLGIAVHTDLLHESKARFSLTSKAGYLESDFVQAIVCGCDRTITITTCPAEDDIMLFHTRLFPIQCTYSSNWVLDHKDIPFRSVSPRE